MTFEAQHLLHRIHNSGKSCDSDYLFLFAKKMTDIFVLNNRPLLKDGRNHGDVRRWIVDKDIC